MSSSGRNGSITVMLVDEYAIVREGCKHLIDREKDLAVVAEAADGRQAIKLYRELSPNVVVMALSISELGSVATSLRLRKLDPNARIVALSKHDDGQILGRMIGAGVMGFVSKICACEELIAAIRTVYAGSEFLSSKLTGSVLDHCRCRVSRVSAALTPREKQVLKLLVEGENTKEAAAALLVTTKTIETHRRNMMKKTGCKSLACLTKYAIRQSITSLD